MSSRLLTALVIGFVVLMPRAARGQNVDTCSQECLLKTDCRFLSLTPWRSAQSHLAPNAEIRENMEITTVDKSAWHDVKAVRSSAAFADAVTGNVVFARRRRTLRTAQRATFPRG
jgi:hypothetical protein